LKRRQKRLENAFKNAFFFRALRALKTPSKRLQNAVKNAFFLARFARSKRLKNAFETPSERRQKLIFFSRASRA
jgi:hypothetical protein